MLLTCFLGNAQASDSLLKAAAPDSQASFDTSLRPNAQPRARDKETVISAERTKPEAVPEPTGLLMSCVLGAVLLAIGQRLRSWRTGAA